MKPLPRPQSVVVLLLVVGFVAACSSGPQPATETTPADSSAAIPYVPAFRLAKGQAGDVHTGMPIVDLTKQYASRFRSIVPETATTDSTYELADSTGKPLLRVQRACKPTCEVVRIEILSPLYLTDSGIGVGSQLSEIRAVYQLSDISFRPEQGLSARIADLGARIVFDASMLDQAMLETTDPAKLPADLLVERIVLE